MAGADSFPDLKELENKVGRKTPESLLVWMRDAADRGDEVWRSDVVDGGDHGSALSESISAKISHLKQEMRWLRCADVRILCQLVSVHEGIEAMRWLMEDRGALASRGSSLTGSLSSLVTVEEPGPWICPCRENPSPTCPQDLTETTAKEPERLQPPHSDDGDSDQNGNFTTPNPKASEARLPSPSSSKFGVSLGTHGSHARASANPASDLVIASLQKPHSQILDTSPLQSIRTGANTIRRALHRSSRVRKEVTEDTAGIIFTKQPGETEREHQTQESFRASQNNSTLSAEEVLLGYDAQWCWLESQEDVTFL